jgi:hypothetical protein
VAPAALAVAVDFNLFFESTVDGLPGTGGVLLTIADTLLGLLREAHLFSSTHRPLKVMGLKASFVEIFCSTEKRGSAAQGGRDSLGMQEEIQRFDNT